MKRLTIVLSDEEYALLEQRAQQDRRTPREMAAFLVTRPQGWTYTPDWTWRPNPVIAPQIGLPNSERWIIKTTDHTTGNLICAGCVAPNTAGIAHTCNQWLTISATNGGSLVN